ncbi:MAG: FprA family A-type flavoprotein [Anaerolineales bacterium]|nr:FprA family A-type flavoprotein [Anaerolineales bacterium]
MTETVEIAPGIHWIGVNDRTTDLFEGMWPISGEGVSYNAYLIRDGKPALIDLVKALKGEDFLRRIQGLVDVSKLEYIVINHMEPDHTGVLKTIAAAAPGAVLICTEKARGMLKSFYGITERIHTVKDGETIPLGTHTLTFYETPLVHWPETMMTWATPGNVLFSCDGFGGFGALDGAVFDDEYDSVEYYEREAERYFANIVAKFSRMVLRAIDKLAALPVAIVAPSHGLIWRKRPERIIELYKRWCGYAIDSPRPEVTLMYATMYGATEAMMNAVARGIAGASVPVRVFDVAHTNISYILPALYAGRGVVVGAPTYEGQLLPIMSAALAVVEAKHLAGRKAAYFGSYGWSGGGQAGFKKTAEALQWEILDSLPFPGNPTPETLAAGEAFGVKFARAVQNTSQEKTADG